MDKQRIGVITGPTASGKTALAIELSKRLDVEIVSADSIQIYCGMDIGSAKPTEAERRALPHHMLDIVSPDTPFSVADFQSGAAKCILDISQRGKLPLIVGGTGLYINSLVYPLDFTGSAADEALRRELTEKEQNQPGSALQLLKECDPASAARLHPHDIKRIIRAVEVFKLTGKPIGQDFSNQEGAEIPYAPIMIGLDMPRELLYSRINARVDGMISTGLVEEVRTLLQSYSPKLTALQGLGYKQLVPYIQGEITLQAATEAIKQETRRFAKRQLTWFRRDKRIKWFDVSTYSNAEALLLAVLPEFIQGKDG